MSSIPDYAKVVTFVRHPFSCANEAAEQVKSGNILGSLYDGFHSWLWSNPPATRDGFLQALLHAKDAFSADELKRMLDRVNVLHEFGSSPFTALSQSISAEDSVIAARASPMFRATCGMAAILATTDTNINGVSIKLEKGILEKKQIYDTLTGVSVSHRISLYPRMLFV